MPPSTQSLTVFVSSTSEDLVNYRKVAKDAILSMQWRPEMMEHFVSEPEPTVEACYRKIDQCDLLLLIVAWRQGWVPTTEQGGNGQDSVTALELAHARAKNIPVLALLASDSWPVSLSEDEQGKRQWIRNFRQNLNLIVAFFAFEDEPGLPRFDAMVKQVLLAHKERILASQDRGAPVLDFFGSARDALLEGRGIAVLGCGVYNDGPLNSQALAKALLKGNDGGQGNVRSERLSLATAAEYRERLDTNREQFLKRFQKVLEQQSKEAIVSPVFDLLAGISSLRLVVSTLYDRILEDKLDLAGRKYVVVAHVLRSADNREDGKVILFRPGNKPELYKANDLHLLPDDCIVYKPLGSPFLHEGLDPDLEIDTVVVTESDHAVFLQRLESPETGVPSPIAKRFMREPLLFLGYTLDVWQYRLMMLVFQVANRDPSRIKTLAVRVPDDAIEEVAWNRLNAQLIRMDPSQFAREAQVAGSTG